MSDATAKLMELQRIYDEAHENGKLSASIYLDNVSAPRVEELRSVIDEATGTTLDQIVAYDDSVFDLWIELGQPEPVDSACLDSISNAIYGATLEELHRQGEVSASAAGGVFSELVRRYPGRVKLSDALDMELDELAEVLGL